MARRSGWASTLIRVAMACVLFAGCMAEGPTPSMAVSSGAANPPSPGPSSPDSTDPPIPEWTFTRIPTQGHPENAAGGPAGLVVVGICDPGVRPSRWHGCDPDAPGDYQAAVLTSSDGRVWQRATVEGGLDSATSHVVWNGTYVATGLRCIDALDPQGCHYEAGIWRSDDGRDWSLLSSFSFGNGRDTHRQSIRSIAASASGALVFGWSHQIDEPGVSGIYRSADGTTWSRVDSREFFIDREWHFGNRHDPYDLIALDAGFLVAGTGCAGCPLRAFVSGDGSAWRHVGDLPVNPELLRLELVTNGRQVVALVILENFSEIWGSSDGGETWTRRLATPGIPTLGAADGLFVLVDDVTYTTDGVQVARVSPDGEWWTELRPVFRADANAEPEHACINFIGGGPDGVLIGSDCGVWHAHLP